MLSLIDLQLAPAMVRSLLIWQVLQILKVTLYLVGVPFEEEVRPNPSRIDEQPRAAVPYDEKGNCEEGQLWGNPTEDEATPTKSVRVHDMKLL